MRAVSPPRYYMPVHHSYAWQIGDNAAGSVVQKDVRWVVPCLAGDDGSLEYSCHPLFPVEVSLFVCREYASSYARDGASVASSFVPSAHTDRRIHTRSATIAMAPAK